MTNRPAPRRLGIRACPPSAAVALLLSLAPVAHAQQQSPQSAPPGAGPIEEVVVFGRGTQLLGAAEAATEGSVGGADLLVRPMLRVAELLEAVPGMVAVQHSGSGKANQYFLRGFNLDHGTDFTTYVDGLPMNLRSHGHGQGYLDVNGLLPEIVERIDYRKGPYRADVGDFSMAGASFISTIDGLDAPYVSFESGDYGWGRIAAGGSTAVGQGLLTTIGELKSYDGPWELGEDLEHMSIWGKYLKDTSFGTMAFTLSGYEAEWRPTEQIPERVIGSAVCADAFCSIDDTATGDTSRWIGGLELTGEAWTAAAYLQRYDWHMQSNPTYDAQINQFDKRTTLGGRYDRIILEQAAIEVRAGAELRHDDIGPVGLDEFDAGRFVDTIGRNDVTETSIGIYTEAMWSPTQRLRLIGGARADYYDFDVAALAPGSFAGSKSDDRVSPKVGLAYVAGENVELYGNWGKGFHSNDARGVVNELDPVPGLSPGTGYEAGARIEIGDVRVTTAYWWLDLDSELIFVGDSNSVEPKGASEREGYEVTLFWRPVDWLGIDAVYTGSKARYLDNPDGRFVEQAVEHAGQIGFSAVKDRWEASLRLRYLGPYALTADNSRRAGSETSVNMRGAYRLRNMTLYADLLNVFDEEGKDIVYYYEAYVDGFDPPGLTSEGIDCGIVNCRMSRIEEPRTLRVGVKFEF